MRIARFHHKLLGTLPSEGVVEYYLSEKHGWSNDARDAEKFLATFLQGLFLTWDTEAKLHRPVVLAVPKALEAWAIEEINSTLTKIHDHWKESKNPALRAETLKSVRESLKHLTIGSRVFSVVSEPPRWVAFGFKCGSGPMPEWLAKGLM